ncbi:hypothetical protein [Demequina sp.]|uniref:hypothetical protein n=1 Tax=Demequina sp. TaxID=2050685 RepID=UPI003A84CBCF
MSEAPDALQARTCFALFAAHGRVDIAAPAEQPLARALAAMGVIVDVSRHAVLGGDGRAVDLAAPVSHIDDGAILTLVSLAPESATTSRSVPRVTARADASAPWWLLGTLALLLLAAALTDLALGSTLLGDGARLAVGTLGGLGSLACGTWWATRGASRSREGAAILVPILLAFSATALALPAAYQGAHLAVTAGLLAGAVLCCALAAVASERPARAIAVSSAVGLLILGAVWALTLVIGMPASAAAMVCMGLVAPGLRWVPTTILNVPEGYAIEYRHFLGNRWSVRGAVPSDPGEVSMAVVRPYVDEAHARLTVGVVLLSATSVLATPLVVAGVSSPAIFERIGAIVLVVATVLGLVLWSRRTTDTVLRWTPRVAAGITVVLAMVMVTASAEPTARLTLAAVLIIVSAIIAAALAPLSRERSALAWSRIGDVLESMSVVLALPAALLAADTLEFVRAMVS